MAESPSHRFGQHLGTLIEELFEAKLEAFCNRNKLYLDQQGSRPEIRQGLKVKWPDSYGNYHQLDYVIEQGGSVKTLGVPIAFIEVAWRRYAKHSKNKVQEIQGAILPIIDGEQFRFKKPFLGAVLAGYFTEPARRQLESQGFKIVYISYDRVLAAFSRANIDVDYNETTPDAWFTDKIAEIKGSRHLRAFVHQELSSEYESQLQEFFDELEACIARVIKRIQILALYSNEEMAFRSSASALSYLRTKLPSRSEGKIAQIEVKIVYTNDDEVQGRFQNKRAAADFISALQA